MGWFVALGVVLVVLGGWWLILLGGLASILIALILLWSLPWSSLRLLGTVIVIELIFHGVGWITFGFASRRIS
jgi:uncharacterized membrane protein HdeD (DUF308 family)